MPDSASASAVRLAQGSSFLSVTALEIGELGSQRAHDARRLVFPGLVFGWFLLFGASRAVVLDALADAVVAVEEVQGYP